MESQPQNLEVRVNPWYWINPWYCQILSHSNKSILLPGVMMHTQIVLTLVRSFLQDQSDLGVPCLLRHICPITRCNHNGPHPEKACHRGFLPGHLQTSLLGY